MTEKIDFECKACGDTGKNRMRDTYPEDTVKIELTCCANCRVAGQMPEITFIGAEGEEITDEKA